MKTRKPFFYCLQQGFVSIKRNKVFFFATVATIAACLFIIGLFVAVVMNVQAMMSEAQDAVCVTVFFNDGLSEEEIQAIGSEISTWEEVDYMEYTSPEQAWENFKQKYFEDYPELAEGFADDNPLANSASYDVYLLDIENQNEIVSRLEATEGVRQVNYSDTMAGALSEMGIIVAVVSAVLIIVLLAVSIFLITNTIITGITLRKEEIQIMKYVGATDFFVKSPFVFEGLIIGLIGAVIPLVILFVIYNRAMSFVLTRFNTISGAFQFLSTGQVFVWLIPLCLVIGAGIGFVGSMIATGRHIKV